MHSCSFCSGSLLPQLLLLMISVRLFTTLVRVCVLPVHFAIFCSRLFLLLFISSLAPVIYCRLCDSNCRTVSSSEATKKRLLLLPCSWLLFQNLSSHMLLVQGSLYSDLKGHENAKQNLNMYVYLPTRMWLSVTACTQLSRLPQLAVLHSAHKSSRATCLTFPKGANNDSSQVLQASSINFLSDDARYTFRKDVEV